MEKIVDDKALDRELTELADTIRRRNDVTGPLAFPGGGFNEALNSVISLHDLVECSIQGVLRCNVKKVGTYKLCSLTGCTAMELPEVLEIKRGGISSNTALTSLYLPKVQRLNREALLYDWSLTKLTLPSITAIEDQVFNQCFKLETLILPGPQVCALKGASVFIDCPITHVLVPRSLVEQYKTATNWVEVADCIQALEDHPELTGG